MSQQTVRTAVAALLLTTASVAQAQDADETAKFVQMWLKSPHADATAEAFTHWNEEGEVEKGCATCHAGAGFRDFWGFDGTAPGQVDGPIATGGVVDCETCHVETDGVLGEWEIAAVAFPSGVTLDALPHSGTCMTCHQGRDSGPGLVERFGAMEPDAPNAELRFQNPHYAAAAATNFGTVAKGLYEYLDMPYVGRFEHAAAVSSCTGCHEPHTLEVEAESCQSCHGDAKPKDIRLSTDSRDYDGDGNTTEGIAHEIEALRLMLLAEIQAYGADVAGAQIGYGKGYPYFFVDTDGDGAIDDAEGQRANAYNAWTPRLLAAAYNFQFVTKDPGGYAHNPHYSLQTLYDSIADLAAASGREMPSIVRP